MKNIFYIGVIFLIPFNNVFGQEGKLADLDSLTNSFTTSLTYSELFDSIKNPTFKQKQVLTFNFLKEYEVKFYDVSKYYFNTSNLIPYNITYEKPTLNYHLVQDHIVIKKRKKIKPF